MSDSGGEFKREIEYLADRAAEQRTLVAENSRPAVVHSRVRRFVWIGAVLALLQGGFLAYQSFRTQSDLADLVIRPPNPDLTAKTCAGERARTQQVLMSHIRRHGEAPASLEVLLGGALTKLPVDPATRQPLLYTKVGRGYRLDCPKVTAP